MRNLINQAVEGQERTGVERLRETGRLSYRAATFQAGRTDDSLAQAIQRFGQQSANLYGDYRRVQTQQADERSNEIIRKLTPEQRRTAIANGTLLYQDDPDAMQALRFKSGRNAAYEVESEIQQKIQEGAFKDQQELSEYRQTRLEAKAKSYAEASGIDLNDHFYQKGFNADIVQREAATYDLHARKLSEQHQSIAQMEATSDLGNMFDDEAFLRSPTGSKDFADYFSHNLTHGGIPTAGMATGVLQRALADNVGKPGAETFFETVGDQEVSMYGRQVKIRDLVGNESLENLKVKAGEAAFNRNRDAYKNFTFSLQNASAQADPNHGLAMLQQVEAGLRQAQPSDAVTQQFQQLTSVRAHLLNQVREDSVARVKALDKQTKADNKQSMFESKYAQRLRGDNVSTDWRTFETNENTGDFKEEDAANFAINTMNRIDQMQLTDDQKDSLKLQYLRADYADGPIRKHFQTLTGDAVNQYNGLVTAESSEVTDKNTQRVREFQRIYQRDPATVASLYPEQAALAERISLMERSGIGLETMIDADRRQKNLSKEERILQDQKWATLFTGSDSSVPYLPNSLRNAARTLFDSELYRTGDETSSKKVVNDWLEKSVVPFKSNDDKAVGAVQKRTLMVDPQDANSWTQGRDILQNTVRQIAKAKPWINEGDITITETPYGIQLNDAASSLGLPPISSQHLREEYLLLQEQQKAALAKKADQKIDTYKQQQNRRKASPLGGLDASAGTLEGAMGYRDSKKPE
ncbi:hypothetical protein HBN99_03700 [Pseudomonas oryzihabitans]|uniref:hypothetical protein n=1 Tax=Pseudomonas oryzihabitans TaxID=47885 RepID=UPI0014755261|nr:hypothetical protein [Pseudomonas oryzihabitans]NMZ63424.1 hypothetical protein [Pseudomonas oryzihabitans]